MTNGKPCAFCTRSMIEERIVAEDAYFYVIASLGQITDGGYALIVPKWHVSCIGKMGVTEVAAMLEIADHTKEAITKIWGKDSAMFEHGDVGQTIPHAHLHLVPADLDITSRIKRDFPMSETDSMISLRDLPRIYALFPEPYLFWKEIGGPPMICWNPKAPDYYFRRLAAEALGRPERANWKTMDPELDKKLWTETRDKLKPFFKIGNDFSHKKKRS